jgi:hypothetical protein
MDMDDGRSEALANTSTGNNWKHFTEKHCEYKLNISKNIIIVPT